MAFKDVLNGIWNTVETLDPQLSAARARRQQMAELLRERQFDENMQQQNLALRQQQADLAQRQEDRLTKSAANEQADREATQARLGRVQDREDQQAYQAAQDKFRQLFQSGSIAPVDPALTLSTPPTPAAQGAPQTIQNLLGIDIPGSDYSGPMQVPAPDLTGATARFNTAPGAGGSLTAPSPYEQANPIITKVPGAPGAAPTIQTTPAPDMGVTTAPPTAPGQAPSDQRFRYTSPQELQAQAIAKASAQADAQRKDALKTIDTTVALNPDFAKQHPEAINRARFKAMGVELPPSPNETQARGKLVDDMSSDDPATRTKAEATLRKLAEIDAVAKPGKSVDDDATDAAADAAVKANIDNPGTPILGGPKVAERYALKWAEQARDPNSPIYGLGLPNTKIKYSDQSVAAARSQIHIQNILHILEDPDVRAHVGPITGRWDTKREQFGDVTTPVIGSNVSPQTAQKIQDLNTSLTYLFTQELKGNMGSRPAYQLAQLMKQVSPRVSEELPLLMGALEATSRASGAQLTTQEHEFFGQGKQRKNFDSGYHPEDYGLWKWGVPGSEPPVGAIVNGMRYKGGADHNASNKNNWEPVNATTGVLPQGVTPPGIPPPPTPVSGVNAPPPGKVLVRRRSDGQMGYKDPKLIDPKIYERQ